MASQPNLKELERRAWRTIFKDGIWDLFFGAVLLWIAASRLIPIEVINLVLALGLLAAFFVAKRLITIPRMGMVRFGSGRKKKRALTTILLTTSVVLTGILGYAAAGGVTAEWIRSNQTVVDVMFAAWAYFVFALMAHWLDFPRLYLIGLVYALVFSHLLPIDTSVTALVGGVLVAVPGVVLLVRFLREYPLPAGAEVHGNG
jgi:hypothetical protein